MSFEGSIWIDQSIFVGQSMKQGPLQIKDNRVKSEMNELRVVSVSLAIAGSQKFLDRIEI